LQLRNLNQLKNKYDIESIAIAINSAFNLFVINEKIERSSEK